MDPNKIKDLPVICLLGPTASGKTELAIKLSKQLPIDIINVDSAQVYREMDIGTAKPSHELLIEFPHRLIDIRDPEDTYSVSNFVKDANDEIAQIHDKQRIPLMVGGTMLYFHALIEGLSKLPNGDKLIRDTIDNEANIIGWPKMHEKLLFIDSVAAKKINPNDEIIEDKGVKVFVDAAAVMYLLGTEMDYKKEEFSSSFVFNNPNESERCGCGESFKV